MSIIKRKGEKIMRTGKLTFPFLVLLILNIECESATIEVPNDDLPPLTFSPAILDAQPCNIVALIEKPYTPTQISRVTVMIVHH